MERASEITRGAITQIYKTGDTSSGPIVQIIELKKISHSNANPNASPRYRLAISDGAHFQQAMIATQLNALISEQQLTVNCLVRVREVICNTVQQKKIVIILNLEVVAQLPAKIGNPISIDTAMNSGNMNTNPQSGGFQQNNQATGFGQNNSFANNTGFGSGGFGGGAPKNAWNPSAMPNRYGQRPHSGSGAVTKIQSNPSTFFRPIQSINPYQNGWTIRGRCTYKSDVRKFVTQRGEGQVISLELTDESGSIRVTGFTEWAQKITETVHLNHIYKVCRGSLKQANEKYNRSTSSFEMTLDRNSVLEEMDDDGTFMQIKYKFTKIAELENVAVKGNCDVVGIVTSVGPLNEIIIRSTNEPCQRRSITITDDSNASVDLTLWRKQAETFLNENDAQRHPVLLLRNATRGDFGGVSLNVSRMTTLELDPVNNPAANKLRAWFDSGGMNSALIQSVTSGPGGSGGKITGERKSLSDARAEDVDPVFSAGQGGGGANATFVTRGMVGFVNTKNDLYYPGDPETKKKVISQGPGVWDSESTGRQLTDDEIVWRYIVSMKLVDHSASQWASGFDEVGPTLFGRPAKEMRELRERDENMFENIVDDALFRPLLMKVQARERVWKDEQQIRYTVVKAEPLDFASEGHTLLKEIAAYGCM